MREVGNRYIPCLPDDSDSPILECALWRKVEVQIGDYLFEDDIVRLEDRYGRK